MGRSGDEQSAHVLTAKAGHGGALNRCFNERHALPIRCKFGQAMAFVQGRVLEAFNVHRSAIGATEIRLGAGGAVSPVIWLERKLGK